MAQQGCQLTVGLIVEQRVGFIGIGGYTVLDINRILAGHPGQSKRKLEWSMRNNEQDTEQMFSDMIVENLNLFVALDHLIMQMAKSSQTHLSPPQS